MKVAALAPVAGMMPMSVPRSEERSRLNLFVQISLSVSPWLDSLPSLTIPLLPRKTSSRDRSTCDTAKSPTSAGTSEMPLNSSGTSNVLRKSPETGSIPTVERKRPTNAAASPLHMAPEDRVATTVSAKTASAKYSDGPNDMAAVASSGAQVTRATALKMPPKNEANVAISSALRDCPLAVSFGPSSRVAAAATVPGVPTRMAVIDPP